MADFLLLTLERLPPGAVYAAVFVLAALENIFPHPPADVGIALAAFLAGCGVLEVWRVFGLAWAGNVSAASAVYLLARRYGRRVLRGRWGHRVVSDTALSKIEAAYRRHGSYGVLLMRLLPVWRGVVPPSAAVAGLPPAATLIPVALASAIWYGALVFLVAIFGTRFDAVRHVLAHVNTVLGLVGLLLFVVLGILIARRLRGPGTDTH